MASTMLVTGPNDPRPAFLRLEQQALDSFAGFFDDQVDWIDAHLADLLQAQAARTREDPAVHVAKLIQTPSRQRLVHAQRLPVKSAARPALAPLVFAEKENAAVEAAPSARKTPGFAAGRAARKADQETGKSARSPLGVSRSIQHDVFGSPPPQPPAFARILSPARVTPTLSNPPKSSQVLLPPLAVDEKQPSHSPAPPVIEEDLLVDMNSPVKGSQPSPVEEEGSDELRDELASLVSMPVSQSIASLKAEEADLSIISEGSEPEEGPRRPSRTLPVSLFSAPPSEPAAMTPASAYQPVAPSPLKQLAVDASAPSTPVASPSPPRSVAVAKSIEKVTISSKASPSIPMSPRMREASPSPASPSISRLPTAIGSPRLRQDGVREGSPRPASPFGGQRPLSPRLGKMAESIKRPLVTAAPSRAVKTVEVPLRDSTSQPMSSLNRSLHRTPTTSLFSAVSTASANNTSKTDIVPSASTGRKSSGGATSALPPSPTSTFLSKNPTRSSVFHFGGLQGREAGTSLSTAYSSARPSQLGATAQSAPRSSLSGTKRKSEVELPERAAKTARTEGSAGLFSPSAAPASAPTIAPEARVEALRSRLELMSKSMGARLSASRPPSVVTSSVATTSTVVAAASLPSPSVEAPPPVEAPLPTPPRPVSPVPAVSRAPVQTTTTPPFTPPVASYTFSAPPTAHRQPEQTEVDDGEEETQAIDVDTEPEGDGNEADESNALTMVDVDMLDDEETREHQPGSAKTQTVFFDAVDATMDHTAVTMPASPQLPTSPPGAFPDETQLIEEVIPTALAEPSPRAGPSMQTNMDEAPPSSIASSATGLISQAASMLSKSFGARTKAKPEVKSLQLAAAAARKEQLEKERKAALKEERRLAGMARQGDTSTVVHEADRKRKEREGAMTGPTPSASSQAIAGALIPKGKPVRPKVQPAASTSHDVGEPAKKRKVEAETSRAGEVRKANASVSRPASALGQSTASQFRNGPTASQSRKPSAAPSSSQPPVRPVVKPAAPAATTSSANLIGVKYMPEPTALRTAASASTSTAPPVRPKTAPAAAIPPQAIAAVSKPVLAPQRVSSKPAPPRASQKVIVAAAAVASEYIELPEIDSEYSDPGDYEGHAKRAAARPSWAQSPAMKAALQLQHGYNPGELFGRIPPLQMEDIFRDGRQSRFRARTSSANWSGADRLTAQEETEYARRMGYIN